MVDGAMLNAATIKDDGMNTTSTGINIILDEIHLLFCIFHYNVLLQISDTVAVSLGGK